MIITPEQAYAIINSPKRLVLDSCSCQRVFFNDYNVNGDEALFHYSECLDYSVMHATKAKLDKCTWHLDHGHIKAVDGDVMVWNGDVMVWPANEGDALVD